MAKLRKIQFFRNGEPQIMGTHQAAISNFEGKTDLINEMLDGEILLYRYKFTDDATEVHTLVGVVHAPETGTKTLEVLANYDMLGGEISAAITAALAELTVENISIATESNGIVTFNGIKQTNGKIETGTTGINLAKVATTGKAEDVVINTTIEGLVATTVLEALAELQGDIDAINDQTITAVADQAVAVTTDEETGNTTVGLVLADGEQVLSQDVNGLKSTLTVDTKKYPTESTTEGYVAEKAGKTYIQIKGIGGEVISETDAAAFVKDGFLQEVELIEAIEGQENVLRFTWNSDAGLQVTDIKVSELCDVYTADETYLHLNGFKFEHKTQNAFTQVGEQPAPQTAFGGDFIEGPDANDYTADANLDTAGTSIVFNVPSFTVDAAGHITKADDKTVKVALPAAQTAADVKVTPNGNLTSTNVQDALAELQGDIDDINAVNWNGDGDTIEGVEGAGEIIVNDTTHTISHKQHALQTTTTSNDTAVKSVVIPQLTINDYGHVTAIDNKKFEIDFNVPTVSGTEGQIVVTSTPAKGTEDINYTVGLAKVVTGEATNVAPTQSTDDYVAEGTTEAPKNKHTRVENITVDAYGRVTAYTLTTVEENWDCGSW